MRLVQRTLPAARRVRLMLLSLAALIGLAPALVGCSVNEATGNRYFNALSRDEEIAIGKEAAPELIAQYGGEVRDPALRQYVSNIGMDLAQYTEADGPQLPWKFTLLDSDVINAFALPGGQVFMSRGLAQRMTNEAQLAGVLGHEIGHVMGEHVDQRLGRAMGVQLGAQIVGILAGSSESALVQNAVPALVGYGGQGYLLSYGRNQEIEADMLGMRYMARAGYNPLGQRQVMEILAQASGRSGGMEFFSTHPHPETRIGRIDELLRTEHAETQNNNPNYRLAPGRFKREFLDRVAELPPALDMGKRGLSRFAHAPWCAVCNPDQ